jgi:hypothetical protein
VAAAAAKLDDVAWRRFPQFEETFKGDGVQQMCGRLRRHADSWIEPFNQAPPGRKARAKAAMQAYGLALELLKQVRGARRRSKIKKTRAGDRSATVFISSERSID